MSIAPDASGVVLHERRGSVTTIAVTIAINRLAQKNAVDYEGAVQLAGVVGRGRTWSCDGRGRTGQAAAPTSAPRRRAYCPRVSR
ncbi:hypothetical protein ACFWD7_31560 [Streptomyces mirabilis]|uniref:hypothetical protein n=1 Tax=Streptomyces mirabilis TaxID=68239 RepID=UPI0021C034CC|nr:hypothetical protein [Streptomyces mirabilis]MCT9112546.1 hypothetical protein [Streptomyces mirabilis]